MKVASIVGARPNFMKLAPVDRALKAHGGFRHIIVHTGQHYDYEMSRVFFEELDIPSPQYHLGVGSGLHGEQTGKALVEIERVIMREKPDIVLVYGDVNSTLAGALAAAKLHVRVGHVEAGLRSFDMTMPEEINRRVADTVSDFLFTPHPVADDNLRKEGVERRRIVMVGDTMIDTLLENLPRIRRLETPREMGLEEGGYMLVTLHRPSNVDERESLKAIIASLRRVSRELTVVFPVHPRTRARIGQWRLGGVSGKSDRLRLIAPLSYMKFVRLMLSARVVLTDSGSIQVETSFLGVPCLTMRDNTERPYTVTEGTNRLIGRGASMMETAVADVMRARRPVRRRIAGCHGRAAWRIAAYLAQKI